MTPRAYLDAVRKRCKERVHAGRIGMVQCSKNATRDGFCATHHPDAVTKRREKSDAAYRKRLSEICAKADRVVKLERIARLAEDYREAQSEYDCFSPTVLQAKAALFAALEELK